MSISSSPSPLFCRERDTMNTLYGNNLGGIIVALLAALALSFGLGHGDLNNAHITWWALFTTVLTLRLVDTLYWRRHLKFTGRSVKNAKRRLIGTVGLTATLLGCFSALLFNQLNDYEYGILVALISSFAAGAAATMAAHLCLAIFYIAAVLLPAVSMGWIHGNQYHQWMSGLGLVFCIFMISVAVKTARFHRQALALKYKNAELVKELHSANRDLESKVKDRTERIFELSNRDSLTTLFNRDAFSTSLDEQLTPEGAESTAAVLFIDLDGFKRINDSLGHDVGDKVLVTIAKRLKAVVSQHDLLCRWGGDEFVVAIPRGSQDEALQLAHRIIDCVSQFIDLDGRRLQVGATIGFALSPQHGTTSKALIQCADMSMYVQKKQQQGKVCEFSPEMAKALTREQHLCSALSDAIDEGSLELFYQPIVNSTDNQLHAHEALLRWQLDGEYISPAEFIPIAERNGMMVSLGNWVLSQACQDAAGWQRRHKIPVSINVSVLQLLDDDFIEQLRNQVQSNQLPPQQVTLEITETLFAENQNLLRERVAEIRALGANVAIDDFGTGYSSLSQLQHLPVNYVKVDRSFVAKLHQGGDVVIAATRQMASALGYQVIAEGVESKAQLAAVQKLGINLIQGFYYAKPAPIDAFRTKQAGSALSEAPEV